MIQILLSLVCISYLSVLLKKTKKKKSTQTSLLEKKINQNATIILMFI